MLLLCLSVGSNIDLEICILRIKFHVEYVLSSGKNNISGDEHSAAEVDILVRVQESKGHN